MTRFAVRLFESVLISAVVAVPQAVSAPLSQASPQVRELAQWIVQSRDHQGRGFALIDKVHARLFVFDSEGRLTASSPVLLGRARGDDSVPGIGERPLSSIKDHEKTTPAGRFLAEPGRNTQGEDVVWVDYDAAVSMHRVRANNPKERRLERLSTPTPADNRISFGCINVPASFYDKYVVPSFVKRQGIVYVLPETRPASAVFGMGRQKAPGLSQAAGLTPPSTP